MLVSLGLISRVFPESFKHAIIHTIEVLLQGTAANNNSIIVITYTIMQKILESILILFSNFISMWMQL